MLPPQLEPAGMKCPLGSELTQAVPFWRAGWDSVGQYLPKVADLHTPTPQWGLRFDWPISRPTKIDAPGGFPCREGIPKRPHRARGLAPVHALSACCMGG